MIHVKALIHDLSHTRYSINVNSLLFLKNVLRVFSSKKIYNLMKINVLRLKQRNSKTSVRISEEVMLEISEFKH